MFSLWAPPAFAKGGLSVVYNVSRQEGILEDARSILAGLLRQLESPATPPAVRLQAAMMANRLALFHGDPSLTDVAESLALDTNDGLPPDILHSLNSEGKVARVRSAVDARAAAARARAWRASAGSRRRA